MFTVIIVVAVALGAEPMDPNRPLDVAGALDFDRDVLPVLAKAGCNGAACHGAAAGRGGFKLSLFAGDPAADQRAIAEELEGRRIDRLRPLESLVLRKATEQTRHGGGARLDLEGEGAERIRRWIAQGATRRAESLRIRLSASARPATVAAVPARVTVRVEVESTDEAGRPVVLDGTRWALFEPADPAAIVVGEEGDVDVLRPGRHVIAVRYLNQVTTVAIVAPWSPQPVDLSRHPRSGPLDEHVLSESQRLGLRPAPRAPDATLLRRVTLDLCGRLPTLEETWDYAHDAAADKYERRVEQLLADESFVDHWTYRLALLLRVRPQGSDEAGSVAYRDWLRASLAAGRGWPAMVRELLLAEGDSHVVGPANFWRGAPGPREQAEFFAESLLGVRIRCANCHNHPLDVWTQDDYHGLAAVFAQVERGRIVRALPQGEVIHPRSGLAAAPRIPGETARRPDASPGGEGRAGDDSDHVEPRRQLAAWLLAADNPFFARNMANRLWQAMLGRGLVEPVDDLRVTNPASHPELLEWLAADFLAHDGDIRHTLRTIALSETYRRSAALDPQDALSDSGDSAHAIRGDGTQGGDEATFRRALPRPLAPEVLVDAWGDAIGRRVPFTDGTAREGGEARAVRLLDPATPSQALDLLGRCPRGGECAEPAALPRGLRARLHLLNGPLLNSPLSAADNALGRLLAAGQDDASIVEELYLRAVSRPPTAAERTLWLREVAGAGAGAERRARLEDLWWALLNCQEFVTNH